MNLKENHRIIFFIVLTLLFGGCVSKSTSVIEGTNYNEVKDITEYFVTPYGSVSLPGKWGKTHYNSVSHQQFFENKDSISIAIAFGRFNKYEFNANGSIKGFEFVKAFYEWDSKYFEENGLNTSLLEQDSINNFMIWRLHGNKDGGVFNSYFLFGEKMGNVSNFSIMKTEKWQEQQKIEFLKNLFLKRE